MEKVKNGDNVKISSMNFPQISFEKEMQILETNFGFEVKNDTYRLLKVVVEWQIQVGHGSLTLDAVKNKFSPKIRINSIKEV